MAQSSNSSRVPGFFKLDIPERLHALRERGVLTATDLHALDSGAHILRMQTADRMIENVVGVMGMPLGLGLNFLINGQDYVVPMVVEEPSIVAGVSGAARIFRLSGGIHAETTDPILIGQVQIANVKDADTAKDALLANREEILNLANSLHPKMVARGGGARDIEVHVHPNVGEAGETFVVVHLLVDTRDAMGANVVNGMCEGIASLIETISGGSVFVRILSNLTDRSMVTASLSVPVENLNTGDYSGERVRDGIILANDWALADPYRAVTHNKGIMNGIDAVALATGNDFRAIEAAAHAYAATSGRYKALTSWTKAASGALEGKLTMPLKVGTVGGSLETNPTVAINHRILGSPNAQELAGIMGAVGLAQNFAALRSLSTAGIQQHHMNLHARSVASTANIPTEYFDAVVETLIEEGDIKVWRAQDILRRLRTSEVSADTAHPRSSACGKVILLGEHAVVYDRPALAVPLPLAVEARVVASKDPTLLVPRWGVEQSIPRAEEKPQGLVGGLSMLLRELNLADASINIEVFPNIPRAMGLGGSAAIAVAVIRAMDEFFKLGMSAERVNELAYACEKSAHGAPSGVDNTIATFGKPLIYKPSGDSDSRLFEVLRPKTPIHLVVGMSGKESLTANMVGQVRKAHDQRPAAYNMLFDQIASITVEGTEAFIAGDLETLGELMNMAHGCLNALQLSTPVLEELVFLARSNGALGAKITGAGGGGSIVALCPDRQAQVATAIETAGYQTVTFTIE
ncbi:MAG: hydroxymethylglutaryl-CoA reductase, degradative [Gammaproteobacteria bacterium]|nr:hydroxymethylglutaryl-CoA reductase, degradative [Gammaproteobacteria bacterium]